MTVWEAEAEEEDLRSICTLPSPLTPASGGYVRSPVSSLVPAKAREELGWAKIIIIDLTMKSLDLG